MPRVLSGGARTSMGRRHAGCGDTIGPHNRMDGWMFIQYAKESNGYIHIFLSSVLCAGDTRSLVSHMIMKKIDGYTAPPTNVTRSSASQRESVMSRASLFVARLGNIRFWRATRDSSSVQDGRAVFPYVTPTCGGTRRLENIRPRHDSRPYGPTLLHSIPGWRGHRLRNGIGQKSGEGCERSYIQRCPLRASQ